jgi:uncharacterized protein (TIGR02246 family)
LNHLEVSMGDDARAIRDCVARWMAATRAGDVAAIADLVTDDAVFLVAGRKPFGKAEFLAAFTAMAGIAIDGRHDIQELHVAGDIAYLRTNFDLIVTQPGMAAISKKGATLTIFRRDAGGRWRLARDANLVN